MGESKIGACLIKVVAAEITPAPRSGFCLTCRGRTPRESPVRSQLLLLFAPCSIGPTELDAGGHGAVAAGPQWRVAGMAEHTLVFFG